MIHLDGIKVIALFSSESPAYVQKKTKATVYRSLLFNFRKAVNFFIAFLKYFNYLASKTLRRFFAISVLSEILPKSMELTP